MGFAQRQLNVKVIVRFRHGLNIMLCHDGACAEPEL